MMLNGILGRPQATLFFVTPLLVLFTALSAAQGSQHANANTAECADLLTEIGSIHNSSVLKFKKKEARIDPLAERFKAKGCVLPTVPDSASLRRKPSAAAGSQQGNEELAVPELDTLTFPVRCTNAVDDVTRIYEIGIRDLDANEYLKFYTVGGKSRARRLKASQLIYGPVRLPSMSIISREGGVTRGLWVERVKTGEKKQLNYLRANRACNLVGIQRVDYRNFWVFVSQ